MTTQPTFWDQPPDGPRLPRRLIEVTLKNLMRAHQGGTDTEMDRITAEAQARCAKNALAVLEWYRKRGGNGVNSTVCGDALLKETGVQTSDVRSLCSQVHRQGWLVRLASKSETGRGRHGRDYVHCLCATREEVRADEQELAEWESRRRSRP